MEGRKEGNFISRHLLATEISVSYWNSTNFGVVMTPLLFEYRQLVSIGANSLDLVSSDVYISHPRSATYLLKCGR